MRPLAWSAALVAALCLGAALGAAWLFGTESGLRWAAARAESASAGRLSLSAPSGTLAGTVRIDRLIYRAPGISLETTGVRLRADLLAALGAQLAIEALQAESARLELDPAPGAGGASPPRLPLAIRLENAGVQRLELVREDVHELLTDVRVPHASVGAEALSAEASFTRAHERFPAQVTLALDGTLRRFELAAGVRAAGIDGDARAVITPFSERKLQRVHARAGPIDLSQFDPALPSTAITAELIGEATAEHALAGTFAAANRSAGALDDGRLPLSSLEGRFASADLSRAALDDLQARLAGTGTLRGTGQASRDTFHAKLLASEIDLRAIRSNLRQTRLRGELQLRLSATEQLVSAQLAQDQLSMEAQLRRAGDVIDVRRLRAVAPGGELSGQGTLHLGDALGVDASLMLAGFDPAAFGDFPRGAINATITATGTVGAQRWIDVRWTLEESTLLDQRLESRGNARLGSTRIERADASVSLGENRAVLRGAFGAPGDELGWQLDIPRLSALWPGGGGNVRASGRLTGSWQQPAVAGSAKMHALTLPGGMALDSASAKVQGTLGSHDAEISAKTPGLDVRARVNGGWRGKSWSGRITALTNEGEYPLRLLAPATLEIARERVELGRVHAELDEGRVLVRGLSWQDGRLSSSGEFTALPAQWLALAAGADERIDSTLLLDGEWRLTAAPWIEGHITVKRRSGDLVFMGDKRLALALEDAVVQARFAEDGLRATAALQSRFGGMTLEGELSRDPQAGPLGFGAGSPLSFRAHLDFAALRVLARPLLRQGELDGQLQADLRVAGTLAEPLVDGTLRGDAIRFELPPYGIYLDEGELRATLEGDALRLERFSIRGGRGHFTASGVLPLRLAESSAKLAWQAKQFTLLERPDRRLVASGEGEAGFDGKRLRLAGALRADRGYLELQAERLPELGSDVVVVGQPTAAQGDEVRLPMALDLDIDLGDDLEIFGRGLEGKLAGRLRLQTTRQGELRAYGRLHTVNATFLAYGQRLQVDPGVLIFDGPIDNPSLQITAWRRNQAVEAGVQVTGTAQAPRVQLVSQPPVPEGEQLSWLVLGRAPGEATQADLGLLQAAAGALLSRGDAVPLDRRIARAVGLDEVALRGSGELENRVVALGKRLSDRLYLSYEQGIGALATTLVKLDFSLSQRWSVRAETGSSSGLGLYYRFSWD